MKIKKIISFVLVLLFSACATTTISSNFDKSFNQKINKVFVVVSTSPIISEIQPVNNLRSENLASLLSSELVSSFHNINIRSSSYSITGLELSKDDVDSKINEYSPDAVLVLKQSDALLHVYGGITKIIFQGELIDSNSEKLIWKGIVTTNGNNYPISVDKISASISKEIFKRFQEDGVIFSD